MLRNGVLVATHLRKEFLMSTADKEYELRRLIARTVNQLLAKDIVYTMAVPVVRSLDRDLSTKDQGSLIQRLWALPGVLRHENGMEAPLYISDTSEIVTLCDLTVNDKITAWIHQVARLPEALVAGVLIKLMEFRESHELEA